MSDRQIGYVALAVLAAVVVVTGWLIAESLSAPTQERLVLAENVGALKLADPVLLNGVAVGWVSDITRTEHEALLVCTFSPPQPVYANYAIHIVDLGIMGDRIVTFSPGTPEAGVLHPADTLRAAFVIGPSEALGMVDQLEHALRGFATVSQRMLEGDETHRSVVGMYHGAAVVIDSVLAQMIGLTMAAEQSFASLLDTVDMIVDSARHFSASLAHRAPALLSELDTLITRVDTVLAHLDGFTDTLSVVTSAVDSLQFGQLHRQVQHARARLSTLRKGVDLLRRRGLRLRVRPF